jgi:hypothetical protein
MLSDMQVGRPSFRFLLRAACMLCAMSACACAPSVAPRAPTPQAEPGVAAALALAAQLPADADACVAARPMQLSAALAALYAPISQAELWVWQMAPRVAAYAQASWERRGRRRWLTLLRFSGDAAAVRGWLTAQSGLDLHWEEDSEAVGCDADRCPTLARFLDAHTLLLVRGALSGELAPGRARGPCAQLLSEHPEAFETSFRRGEALFLEASSDVPRATRSWTFASSSGLVVEREEQMADEPAAQRGLERDACRELWGGGSTALEASCERSRAQLTLRTSARVHWDDLRLRRDDAARHALAQRYAEALENVRPDDAVDLANLADVWRELALRRTLIESSGADRRPQALELLRFVERALTVHPAEPRLLALRADLERMAQVTAASGPAMTAP